MSILVMRGEEVKLKCNYNKKIIRGGEEQKGSMVHRQVGQ